jgi:hypothetical protein
LQYLEDCGLLSKILKGEICPHYRIYKSQVFYRHSNQKGKKFECLECANEEAPIVLETNYLDSSNLESHELCLFFERNRLPFKLQSPHPPLPQAYAFKHSDATHHRLFIHHFEVSLEQLFTWAKSELLTSIITGRRCLGCLCKLSVTGKENVKATKGMC